MPNLRSIYLFALALAVCCSTVCGAMPQASDAAPRFSGKTEVVLVPVMVYDKDHRPVLDLKADDFTVLDEGKPQRVTSFDRPATIAVPVQSVPGEYTNIGAPPPRRLTIIAFDPVYTPFGELVFARDAMLRYVSRAIEEGDRVAIVSLENGGFRLIHDFSSSPEVLRRAIAKARMQLNLTPLTTNESAGEQSLSPSIDHAVGEIGGFLSSLGTNMPMYNLIESMRAVAREFRDLPGRKSMVWVTSGFPLEKDLPVLASSRVSAASGQGTPTALWEGAFQALHDANIAVYPVDARGLVALLPGQSSNRHNSTLDALTWVAYETGGKAYVNTNDILNSVNNAAAESDSGYMLSYQLPAKARKGWHIIKVRVNRKGVKVVAREGFYAGRTAPADEDRAFASALKSPFPQPMLPMTVRFTAGERGANGKSTVHFQFSVAPAALAIDTADTNHVALELRTLARTPEMAAAASFQQSFDAHLKPESLAEFDRDGFRYDGQLELAPGDYEVHFAARDKLTGRMGTVTAPLHVN